MSWVKVVLTETSKEIKEIEPRREPRLLFVCEPKEHLHDVHCELEAQVPKEIEKEIIRVWEEIKNEQDTLEIANKLIAIALEYDDNPNVYIYYNNYETRIEINPD